MSDNPAEMCVSTYDANGRVFTGGHGSGLLDGNGNAINDNWLQMTKGPYAYINRGMYFVNAYYDVWTANTNGMYSIYMTAGMISSRFRFNHGGPVAERDYTGRGMRGIRCARTEGATY